MDEVTSSTIDAQNATSNPSSCRRMRKWLICLTVANIVICASTIAFVICSRTQRRKSRHETKTEARESSGHESSNHVLGMAFLRGGTEITLGVDEEQFREAIVAERGTNITEEVIQRTIEEWLSADVDERICAVLRRRLTGIDMKEAVVQGMKGHRFRVLLPAGTKDAMRAEVKRTLQSAAYLEFRLAHPRNHELTQELMRKGGPAPEGYAFNNNGDGFVRLPDFYQIMMKPGYKTRLSSFGKPPQGYHFMLERDKDGSYQPNYISRKPELTGLDIVSARVDRDEVGRTTVAFKLNRKGGKTMSKISRNNIGRQLGIVLDGNLISAPILMSEIGTSGQISGNFTPAEAKRLANDLNAGALPVPLTILAEEILPPQRR